jgi:beta-lactamase regulating signal transducer with metallopeptidase domain
MLAATVAGTVTTLGVLWVCRWPGIAPLAKVWLCRLALLKWPVGLFFGVGIAVGGPGGVAPSWVAPTVVGVFVLWVVGIALVAAESAVAWSRCRRTALSLPAWEGDVSTSAKRVGILGTIDVRRSAHAFVMLAPGRLMVLPESASMFVVLHELAHLRHRDLLWSGVASLVQCAFWFHPLVESLHREMRLWQDVVADQTALQLSGTDARSAADEIMASASPMETAPALALGADAKLFARRFRLLYGERRSVLALVAGFAISLALLVPLLPAPRPESGPVRELYQPVRSPMTRIATMHRL